MRLIIVSGRSGSGKSTALNVLEDNGFYCIDNLPAEFLEPVAERLAANGTRAAAVAIDEAVELAKELSTEDSGAFVHGVLARIDRAGYEAQQMRSETGIGAAGASAH